ncbi:MAG: hypothetical protein QNJ54_10455, partial [Prochloraceae cyanobacterium]|nr:hypothetical protein [Prochloraceae cyanobacterium]
TPSILLTVPTQTGSTKLTTLTAISNLVSFAVDDETTAETIANNMNTLLHTYMMQDTYEDSLLTSPQDIDFSHVYQASQGDGFVISTVEKTKNGSRGYVQAFDGTTPNPTTMRATASQHYYTNHDTWIPYASLTMPTPANTYYSSEFTSTSSDASASLKFVGLGNIGEEGMGEWQEVEIDSELTANSDGFVLAYVDWNNKNGSRGYVKGLQQLSGSSYTVIAGASQHKYTNHDTWVPTNSFCMPVRKNTKYKVEFTKTSSSPIAKAFFVPFSEELVFFNELQDRNEGRVYQAQSDGFLVAYIYEQKNGDRGYVHLYSYPDINELTQLGKMASTSIHYYTNHDTYVPYNSAMIPVSKNDYYKAAFTKTAGNPGIKLSWISLGIQS